MPTPAGSRLQQQARALLDAAQRVRAEVVSDEAQPSGEVAVGIPTFLRAQWLRPALQALSRSCPGIRVHVLEGTSRGVRDTLASGAADVAVASTLDDVEFLDARPVVRESLYLIGPRGRAELAPREVSPERLAKLPLALTSRPNSLRAVVDRQALGRGEDYRPRYEVQSLEMALELIDAVGVFSVFPGSGIGVARASGRIGATRLRGCSLTWALITSRERLMTSAADRLYQAQACATPRARCCAGDNGRARCASSPSLNSTTRPSLGARGRVSASEH